ncbi:hypothetical protein J1605_016133 [Eschrichtius robustus]|uniref:Uncharacterized protein n=1 Tax=Eschrichtius robustus TaxID=9764 RepID=A0AB34GA79_ESCRO|nr:hypothetical protein J1605_016133 [Eschrichtius robustus]
MPPALPTRPAQLESLTHLHAGSQRSTFLEKSVHILQGGPFPSAEQGSSVSGPAPLGQGSSAPDVKRRTLAAAPGLCLLWHRVPSGKTRSPVPQTQAPDSYDDADLTEAPD